MKPFFRLFVILTSLAALAGCAGHRHPKAVISDRPAVLVCDFDDLLGIHGYWQFPRFSSELADAVVRQLATDPKLSLDLYRPVGAEGVVHSDIPSHGYDYFVTGTLFCPDNYTVLVTADILNARGIQEATLKLYLDRDTDRIEHTVSRSITKLIAELPAKRQKKSVNDTNGGLAFASGVRNMERDPYDARIKAEFLRSAYRWPRSPEPWRKLALKAWRISDMQTAILGANRASARVLPRLSHQLSCLATVIAEDCAQTGWNREDAYGLAWQATRQFPDLARLVAVQGQLGDFSRPDQDEMDIENIETGVLSHCSTGAWLNASYTMMEYSRIARNAAPNRRVPDSDALLAAAALQWRNDDQVRKALADRGWKGISNAALLEEARRSDSPSVNLVVAHWLYGHLRPAEGADRLRGIQGELAELSTHRPFLAPLVRTVENVLKDGRWENDQIVPANRQSTAVILEMLPARAEGYRIRETIPDSQLRRMGEPRSAGELERLRILEQGVTPDFAKAVEGRQSLSKKHPGETAYLERLGRSYLLRWDQIRDAESLNEGLSSLSRAIALAPDQAPVYERAAWELAERGVLLDQAGLWAERLRRVRSGDARSLCLTGWIAAQAGYLDRAERELTRAVEMSFPDSFAYADAALRLVDVALRKGDVAGARRWLTNTPQGEDSVMPADNPWFESVSRLTPDAPPVRVVAAARTVAVYDDRTESKKTVWYHGAEGVIWSLAVADIDGDDRQEVIIGTSCEGSARGFVHVLNHDGAERWRFKLAASLKNWPDDHMAVRFLKVEDLDGDGKPEVVACASHHPWFPSRLCVLSREGRLKYQIWNPGTIENVKLIRRNGRPAITIAGVNNSISRADGYRGFSACLDLHGVLSDGETHQMPVTLDWQTSDGPAGLISFPTAPVTAIDISGGSVKPAVLDKSRFALLIANDETPKGYLLEYTGRDVEELGNRLPDLGYAARATVLCKGTECTRNCIALAARESSFANFIGKPNIIYVHYSGHAAVVPGRIPGTRDVAMMLKGSRNPDDSRATLHLSEIPSLFGRSSIGASFVVTLDACLLDGQSGVYLQPDRDSVDYAEQVIREIARAVRGRRLRVILGCKPGTESREYGNIQGGLFSAAIVKTLDQRTADIWSDNELTDHELFTSASREIDSLMKSIPGSLRQKPFAVQSGPPVSIASVQPGQRRR